MTAYTRNAIKNAYIALLDERPGHRITVKDVVNRCGINRNTFYYYFQDLPALGEAIVAEYFMEILPKDLTLNSLRDCLNAHFNAVALHREALLALYRITDREQFEISQWRIFDHITNYYLDTVTNGRHITPGDKKMLQEYFCSTLFGMAMDSFRKDLTPGVLERLLAVIELNEDQIEQLLEKCEQRALRRDRAALPPFEK